MERIPQPIMDKRGEPHMKRFEDQRWVLDNIVRSNGIDWDQPRSIYISGPCGMEGQADIAVVRERVKKMADIAPAFEAVAVRREAKAKAAEEAGSKITARDNYFMSAVYWGAAQWPYDQNDEANVACHLKKRENYTKYAAIADHKIEAAWIPFKDTALPAWFHLPPGYSGGKLPVIINVPGMDSYKEIQTALYGDRFLNRGFAVLNIDGPGQYESPMLGIYFSMDNWVATGKAVCDWLAKRPEVDMGKVVLSGTSFGTFFGTIATAHEPRISAAAVISVCHEPGCHTIFQEASPTFKKRFMYMSGITDEAEFDKMRQGMTWEGHADKVKVPVSLRRRRVRRAVAGRAFAPAGRGREGPEAHGGVSGLAPLGRQRAGGEPRPVPADPGGRLARRPRRRQAVRRTSNGSCATTVRSTRSRCRNALR